MGSWVCISKIIINVCIPPCTTHNPHLTPSHLSPLTLHTPHTLTPIHSHLPLLTLHTYHTTHTLTPHPHALTCRLPCCTAGGCHHPSPLHSSLLPPVMPHSHQSDNVLCVSHVCPLQHAGQSCTNEGRNLYGSLNIHSHQQL